MLGRLIGNAVNTSSLHFRRFDYSVIRFTLVASFIYNVIFDSFIVKVAALFAVYSVAFFIGFVYKIAFMQFVAMFLMVMLALTVMIKILKGMIRV